MTRISTWMLCFALLATCTLSGQGQGIPSSMGLVPTIEVQHRAVGLSNLLVMAGFSPGSQVSLLVAFSANPTPLASVGLGPAVLGPDPNSIYGAVTFNGFVADANGNVMVPFSGDPNHAHWLVHMQAFAIDPAALYGAALSRHEVFIFGQDRERVALAVDVGGGREALLQTFPYGALAGPIDPRLTAVDFLPIILANSNEMGHGREDLATPTESALANAGVQIPGGNRLLHLQHADGRSGWVMQRDDADLEVLLWAQGSLAVPAFAEEIAVSAFDPYLAVAAENPLPEYGQATLVLARTDGMNIPNSHLDWFPVPNPGYPIESSSLCFLQGALFFGDGETRLDRLDLQTMTLTPVVFPNSGGSLPIYVDESMTAARGGSALAIGAGVDKNLHDIYWVTANGSAQNLTNLPGDYEDAGPGEPDGMQLAIADDGSVVAYMRTVVENELFIKATSPGAPEIPVTHAAQYINSIDTVVGLGFKTAATALVFSAGKSDAEVDVYEGQTVATGVVNQIANLSATSTFTQPVFGLGASLSPRSYRSLAQGYLLEFANSAGADRLQLVGPTATLALNSGPILATAPLGTELVVVDEMSPGQFRTRVTDPVLATVTQTHNSVASSSLVGQFARPGVFGLLTADASGGELQLLESTGLLTAATPSGSLEGGMNVTPDGRILVLVRDPVTNQRRLEEYNRSTQTWQPLTTMNMSTTALRFLP